MAQEKMAEAGGRSGTTGSCAPYTFKREIYTHVWRGLLPSFNSTWSEAIVWAVSDQITLL
jgi:hypothetical protein